MADGIKTRRGSDREETVDDGGNRFPQSLFEHSSLRFSHLFQKAVLFSTNYSGLLRMPLRSRFPRIYALSSNDIKVGSNIEVDGAPYRVLEFLHVKPGKGAAFVRTKVRNYITGNTVEKTFRAGSMIEEADVMKEKKQYTYKDGSNFVFMDMATFEETRLSAAELGDRTKWLKEGMDCNLLFWNGRVIDLELPITVKLTVTDVDPGLEVTLHKGDRSLQRSKLELL
ncbi:hypothetical protein HPP92_017483 [Vanilla planifolia]|uniref:Translation elongation factor P/YeiP central domain-containing protein n=1 Tax=Vanilla planifolia TaxID=51239 RepID=A0A835Q824_VANPL|nr:hypothetical protein HPP92_017483 [Vanilla planifolia]